MSDDQVIAEQVDWYGTALGLDHFRTEIACPDEHEWSGSAGYKTDYPNATITIRRTEAKDWSFDDREETVIHELLHLAMRDLHTATERALKQLPKPVRKVCAAEIEQHTERVVETLSRSIKAIAYADRQAPPPRPGKLAILPQEKH